MSANSPSSPSAPNDRRSNSFVGGFIKRTRSSDLLGERKPSNNLFQSKPAAGVYGPQTTTSPVQTAAPKLPTFSPAPQLQTFGGEDFTPVMDTPQSSAASTANLHERTQSMTNRGRYSYAPSTISSVNSPRRVRRRKDPTPYNILIIGARNSGKTSFLNFLKSSIAPRPEQQNARNPELDLPPPSVKLNPGTFIQHYQEIEVEGERVGISIWDSKGFDRNLVDYQLREMNNFVESKFEDTFIEEMKVMRAPGLRDTHIHCVFFLFDPAQLDINIHAARTGDGHVVGSLHKPARVVGALDEDFELQILKSLQGKTTVIPVISKADTVTTAHMAYLKSMVGESFQKAGLDPLEALHFEGYDSEEEAFDEADESGESPEQQEMSEEQIVEKEAVEPEPGLESTSDSASASEPEVKTEAPRVFSAYGAVTGGSNETATDAAEETPASSTVPIGDDVVYKPTRANTRKSLTHKRDNSKLSVSTVMFDNGYMPMSILSPDEHSLRGLNGRIGRSFVWGFADPYNPQHCDFVKLKETCFIEWRADFREASRVKFYERWRTGRLNRGPANGVRKEVNQPQPPPAVRKTSSGIPIDLVPRKKYPM